MGTPASARLPVAGPESATRQLCATAYLEPDLAVTMRRILVGDGLSAVGPPAGVDLPVLLQHVNHALRIQRLRDWALAFCALLGLVSAGPLALALRSPHIKAAAGATAIGLAAVAALAWTVTTTARWLQVHTAASVARSRAPMAACAPPLRPAAYRQAVADQGATILCYAADSPSPFIGFGAPVDKGTSVHQPVTIARLEPDAAGAGPSDAPPMITESLDLVDLHMYLREQMRNLGVPGLSAKSMLHIRGDAINGIDDLWSGGRGRRPPQEASALLWSGIMAPGDRSHTYLRLEAVRFGGHLVVTMHVRLRFAHGKLSLEVASHVLAPLGADFGKAGGLPLSNGGLRAHARWQSLSMLPKTFAKAPGALARHALERRAAERRRLDVLRSIRSSRYPDRGAQTSVRRFAMDWSRMQYQETADAADILQRLRLGLYEAIRKFLVDNGIDTSELAAAKDGILKVEMNFYGDLTADVMAFGPQATAFQTGS